MDMHITQRKAGAPLNGTRITLVVGGSAKEAKAALAEFETKVVPTLKVGKRLGATQLVREGRE